MTNAGKERRCSFSTLLLASSFVGRLTFMLCAARFAPLLGRQLRAPLLRPSNKVSFHSSALAMAVQRVKVASAAEAPKSGSHKDFTFAGEGDDALKM